MIDETTIQQAAKALLRTAPKSRIILYGSHARGEARADSDLDLMVIQPSVESTLDEYVRLRLALSSLQIPVDITVASQLDFDRWSKVPNSIYYQAATEGRVLDGTD